MDLTKRFIMLFGAIAIVVAANGQNRSTATSITRKTATQTNGVSVADTGQTAVSATSGQDADMEWIRVVYRSLDLDKTANAPLYYPVDPVDGQENLFRIIVSHVADNTLPAYEFLDGREVFTDKYRVNPREMFDNFEIAYTEGKGSTDKKPRLIVDENDVPSSEVLSYYVIERWSFSRRDNKVKTHIEALCPVMHRVDEHGMGRSKYPLCWIRYADLQPYLSGSIIMSDDNNMATGSYDDYFRLGLYDGEIYKTQNLRNRMLAELYPDPDRLKYARDSIQQRLDSFDKKLWVPSLDELQKKGAVSASDSASVAAGNKQKTVESRSASRRRSPAASKAKPKSAPKAKSSTSRSSSATRSVRDRKR